MNSPEFQATPPSAPPMGSSPYRIATARFGPSWRALERQGSQCELFFVTRGYLGAEALGARITAETGEGVLLPSGVPYSLWAAGGQPLEGLVVGLPEGILEGGQPRLVHDSAGRVRLLLDWLFSGINPNCRFEIAAQASLFEVLRSELSRLERQEDTCLEQSVREFILENLQNRITLQDLADNSKMSRCHFSRVYRRLTGVSPMESLRLVRLERAKELILTTQAPLKAIAVDVGLGSEFQLSRLLRSRLGVGARELRARRFTPNLGASRASNGGASVSASVEAPAEPPSATIVAPAPAPTAADTQRWAS